MKDKRDGSICMDFIKKGERTVADRLYREGNSRISADQHTYDDIPFYFLISTGGGFTEGESYVQNVDLGRGCHAVLTTQTPTYIYKCDHKRTTNLDTYFRVEDDAVLELYMDEVIPYKDAIYKQHNRICMERGSTLIMCGGLTGGWSPDEKPFEYGSVDLWTQIETSEHLIYNDRMILDPSRDHMDDMGFFAEYTNYNEVIVIDHGIDQGTVEIMRELIGEAPKDVFYGISLLENDGMTLKILSRSAYSNHLVMWDFICAYREKIKRYDTLDLRKRGFV